MQNKILISNFQALKTYGYNYYSAYIPSLQKLEQKLLEKSQNKELSKQVLRELSTYIDEQKNIRSYIRYYRERNKNISYIRQKLKEKLFKKEEIEYILQTEILSSWESILNREYILKKVSDLKEKGKSKNAIRQKLIERKEDSHLVETCIQEIFWEENENSSLKKALEKILKGRSLQEISRDEKQKLIQKLLLRGFEYSEIKNYLASDE